MIENGYITKTEGKNVLIIGSSLQWAVRGMYAFLEKFGGINVYTSTLTVFKNSKITVPSDLNETYVPYFEYTDTDWLSPHDVEYSLFNGLNGSGYRIIDKEFGGNVSYISSFCHTLTGQFCSKDKYYEEHPEYFALYRGIRADTQLCLSNPDVLEIVTNEVFELLEEKHDPEAELQIISLTQADNFFYCTCSKCAATDHKYGSHAGTMLEFVNAIARKVKAAGYDNVAIDTFAYRYTRTPPKGIVPDDNVIVRLCSIECCFSHPFDDENCEANKAFMDDLEGWSAICNRIYIWDYCTNYCNYVGLFPDFGVLQRNIQVLYEHNVKGIYEEGNYSMNTECEFGELRAYLISKLYQNPYLDYEEVRNDFTAAYYGAGSTYINEFLDIMTENASEKHLGIYESMLNTLSLSCSEVKKCDALWESAKNATEGQANANVRASEIAWRWWKMKNRKCEFSNPFSYKQNVETLNADIENTGVATLREVGEFGSAFNSTYQFLYFKVYRLVKLVLDLLYIS